MNWADDPELVATFRAEVEERLASLTEGLLRLEDHASPRQLVGSLFRDAHTVKGSARMLGLDALVQLAHRCEDLLGALRDGRLAVRTDLVDVLLVAAEALARALPGAERPIPEAVLADVVGALDAALAGQDPVAVPRLHTETLEPEEPDDDAAYDSGRGGEHVRVPTRRVHLLLDLVSEADLDVRRVHRCADELTALVREQQELVRALRTELRQTPGGASGELTDTVNALLAVGERMIPEARELRGRIEDAGSRLARVRDGAMELAMVPVRRVVAGFPALVRELASATGKDVLLETKGAEVELDVQVLDGVAEALRHLVTNAVDHGCEPSTERVAAGKSRQAVVTVAARQVGSTVVIEVADDGRGIDDDALRAKAIRAGLLPEASTEHGSALYRVLFAAGFTTRDDVTETSGRGVGLDVVRSAVEGLGGAVEVESSLGEGTRFLLTLPVTTGVVRCLMVRAGSGQYAIPMSGVLETVSLADSPVHTVAGSAVLRHHGATVPVADLAEVLGSAHDREPRVAVLFRFAGHTIAWSVDELEGEREVVVRPLGSFIGHLPGVGGATRDADGSVLLLLDLRELGQLRTGGPLRPVLRDTVSPPVAAAPVLRPTVTDAAAGGADRPRVLVVEDSVGVRELQRTILEGAGYAVLTAVDGLDGAARLAQNPVDLVLSDVEMPGMDGFTLTRTIRSTRGWENVPVVIMTSRGDDADKRAGLEAGADAYLLKSEFDQGALVSTVRRLVGR